jgi:hypothetical protein
LYHRNVEQKVRGRDKRRVEQSGTSEQKEVRGREKRSAEKSGDHAVGVLDAEQKQVLGRDKLSAEKLEAITHTRQ